MAPRSTIKTSRLLPVDCLAVGLAVGLTAGVALFILERGAQVPDVATSTLLAVYLVCAGLSGLAGGLLAALWSLLVGPERGRVATLPVAIATVGGLLTAVFMLRDHGLTDYAGIPGAVLGNAFLSLALWGAIGVTGARVAKRREFSLSTRAARALLLVTLVPAMGVWIAGARSASSLPGRAAAGFEQPNLVLLVVGSLRPDHLGAGRYHRPTSPRLDELAETGVYFDNVYSHSGDAAMAFTSLVTGRYPVTRSNNRRRPDVPDARLLDEMKRAGYTCVALGGGPVRDAERAGRWFDRSESFGLERYRLSVFAMLAALGLSDPPELRMDGEPVATEVSAGAQRWVDRLGDRPYLLTVRLSDLEAPRLPPAEVWHRFRRGETRHDPHTLYLMSDALRAMAPPLPLKPEDLDAMVDVYDATVAAVDDAIGQLVAHIHSRPTPRETIVIVTADHGEEFMEHGRLGSASAVTEELLRVPLIFWSTAGLTPQRVAALTRHVDVMPTLADLAGAEREEGVPGHSVAGFVAGASAASAGETVACAGGVTALNTPEWKIVRVDSTQAYYVYSLKDDPWALTDVSGANPDVVEALQRRLAHYDETTEPLRSRSWTDN